MHRTGARRMKGSARVEGFILPILLLLLVFFMFNSQRKRQRQFQQMQSGLALGQDVVTTAGLHGRIVELDDEVAVLETSPGQTVRWERRAIGRILEVADRQDDLLDADEQDVGPGADPADSGVDLNKATPPNDEK
jgi:preprotein translocase subunit YajC